MELPWDGGFPLKLYQTPLNLPSTPMVRQGSIASRQSFPLQVYHRDAERPLFGVHYA